MSTLESVHEGCAEGEEDGLYEFVFDLNQKKKEETESDHMSYSCGHTPEIPTASLEQMTHATDSSKLIKKDEENIQSVVPPNQTVQAPEDKPWRKSGADPSDYFNYGFDEQSWRQYCEKQFRLKAYKRRNDTKNRARAAHTSHSHVSSYRQPIKVIRESEDKANVSRGQTGRSHRDERQPRLTDAGNKYKVTTKMSHKGDRCIRRDLPPLLPCFRLGRPVPPPSATLGRDQRSTSQCRSVFSKERNVSKSRAVTGVTKDWKCFITQKTHGGDGDSTRENGHDKKRKASRDRKNQSSHSSHNSRKKHRDAAELSYKGQRGRKTKKRKEKSHQKKGPTKTHIQKESSMNKQFSCMPSEDAAAAGGDRTTGVKTKHPKKETKAKMWRGDNQMISAGRNRINPSLTRGTE
nr:pre-mRNA 3'-end-processing factor FIP1 isoform X3 [Nothobranchius furzeri]